MKSKIESIVKNMGTNTHLKWTSDTESYFSISNNNKKIIGRISFTGNEIETAIDFTNYSKYYLKSKIKNIALDLNSSISYVDFLNYQPQPGDVIRVLFKDGLQQGDIITLEGNTYYFSINDSYIDCDGRRLRQEVSAKYIDSEENRCIGGGNTVYSIFQLA